MVSLAQRISALGSTALLAASEGEVYSARGVSRSMQEHWIRLVLLVLDIKRNGEESVGDRYWVDLAQAETLRADQDIRSWFPVGVTNQDLAAFGPVASLLVEPRPTNADYDRAMTLIREYGFKRVGKALLGGVTAVGPFDRIAFGALAAAYATLSGAVHGGPAAHAWLLETGWLGRQGVAVDAGTVWATALTFVRAQLAGGNPNDKGVIDAQEVLASVVDWAHVAAARVSTRELI